MSDFEKSRNIWRLNFAFKCILYEWDIKYLLQLAYKDRLEDDDFEKYLKNIDLSYQTDIKKFLNEIMKCLAAGEKPTKIQINKINKLLKLNFASLKMIFLR